jgi:hypothetical protein
MWCVLRLPKRNISDSPSARASPGVKHAKVVGVPLYDCDMLVLAEPQPDRDTQEP